MTAKQLNKINALKLVLEAVKQRCKDCSAFSLREIKHCQQLDCSLHNYRFGNLNNKTQ